jgi:hypothetical protein
MPGFNSQLRELPADPLLLPLPVEAPLLVEPLSADPLLDPLAAYQMPLHSICATSAVNPPPE